MKSIVLALGLTLGLLTVVPAHASLNAIFQSIADETPAGNGDGHSVITQEGPFDQALEIAKLQKEVAEENADNDCLFDVYADTQSALEELAQNWEVKRTALRVSGLVSRGLIQDIIYSDWDPSSGDDDYCSKSTMKVFGVDGTVLIFDFNETD